MQGALDTQVSKVRTYAHIADSMQCAGVQDAG
jgi:hypothetical protein